MPTAKELGDQQIAATVRGDWDTLRRLYADDVQYVDPDGEVRGIEAAIARLQLQAKPLSNMSYEISALVADERRAVVNGPLPPPAQARWRPRGAAPSPPPIAR